LLPLIQAYSQEAGAPGQVVPISAATQPVAQPLSPEASFFYDQLAPYGQWLWIDPYGWVWSPNNVTPGWRPYTDGHWVFADFGWTWVSDLEWAGRRFITEDGFSMSIGSNCRRLRPAGTKLDHDFFSTIGREPRE